MTRPPLPSRHANPHIQATLNSGVMPPVKYQILNCQGQDILVGRMKIETPTPTGHAFILRRFDTGAISLTTMFRAAFPTAPDDDEKREVAWVKESYDLSGNNGSSKEHTITRLAGTWVSPSVAKLLGEDYRLGSLITSVIDAQPDPNGNYRRSGKGANATPKAATVASPTAAPTSGSTQAPSRASLPTPSPTALPNPAKRRKESSPAPVPSSVPAPPSVARAPPRRSARTKSPAPKPAAPIAPLISIVKTPKKTARREEVLTPGGSDETAVEDADADEGVDDVVAGSELRQQDIADQKELIEDLKAQRDAAMRENAADVDAEVDGSSKLKRAREETEEKLQFEFKEPEVGERAIVTNRRVSSFRLEPRQKSFAWGVAAFAFGLGAVTFLPSLF